MKWLSRIFLAAVIATGMAIALTMLMQGMEKKSSFATHELFSVNEYNLVDFIAGVPLESKLARVDWSDPALIIDLKWNEQARTSLYDDYARLIANAFMETDNVERLYIRVGTIGDEKQSDGVWIQWLEADRTHFSMEDYFQWLNRNITSENWIKTRFDLEGIS